MLYKIVSCGNEHDSEPDGTVAMCIPFPARNVSEDVPFVPVKDWDS